MKTKSTLLAILCAFIIALTSTGALAESQSKQEQELMALNSFLGLMENYLDVAERWVKMVSAKESTIYIITEKVVEIYEEKGEKMSAVPELRRILAKYGDNPTIRSMIHLKIAEIYKETGQATKALEELKAIIDSDRN